MRQILVKRKTWLSEQLVDRIHGREPQEEVTEIVNVPDADAPTEADKHEREEEEREDAETKEGSDEELDENNFTEEEA